MQNHQHQGNTEEFHLPEWETTARHRGEKPAHSDHKPSVIDRGFILFDRVIPRRKIYCGFSRKIIWIALSVVSLVLLALILGLAIGLSKKSRYVLPRHEFLMTCSLIKHLPSHHQNLPLGSQAYTGDLTYYGPGLGACGVTSSDTDHIVSISHFTFDAVSKGSNPNANPLCGHKLRAIRNGNSIDLTVVDRCMAIPVPASTKWTS